MREELSTGFGHLVTLNELTNELKSCSKLMAVGDMVSYTLLNNGFKPDLIVFDLKTERRKYTSLKGKLGLMGGEEVKVKNPAGYITAELVNAIGMALDKEVPTKLQVEGEEDLAALACAAMAPLGSCLVYGLPGIGMAMARIDAEIAGKATSLIYAMEELN
jgi:GTP-dependent dephospho-CoA kinase